MNRSREAPYLMEELSIHNVSLENSENQKIHRTQDFSSSKALVVRRGAPFRITLHLKGRPFNVRTDTVMIRVLLGPLSVTIPVAFSKDDAPSLWSAYFNTETSNPQFPTITIRSPASVPVGTYTLHMFLLNQRGKKSYSVGNFVLLCNPWCREDAVFVPFEDQREEYVQTDSGLLYIGTAVNIVSRPWSFDQYEPGVLEACLDLLQVSPQHSKNRQEDYLLDADPVYISRVVSAMINSEDDRGVLKGNWSGKYKDGVNPAMWTGSGDILRQWASSGFSPVKYGQCWVFAAVMCTVMRVLGIPCRVVTNFNSAHDTNGNLVIEEFYSETGKKLPQSKDSVWNFHVWVECWMKRGDLETGMDGWQVLDPTPQERSSGVFCCGPAPVRAVRDRRVDLAYDIPFVYAEVNADVCTFVVRQNQVLSYSTDKQRVGSLICTKAIGNPRPQNITANYKHLKSPKASVSSRSSTMSSSLRSRGSTMSENSTLSRSLPQGLSVYLRLEKGPIVGEPILFTVTVNNNEKVAKVIKENLNAQAKEYNHSPSDSFWETHNLIRLAPLEAKVVHHQISPAQYEVVGGDLINLAVVLKDEASQERVLASEEFNIARPQLNIKITDEYAILPHRECIALVTFTNPCSRPVSGMLSVARAGLIQGKVHFRMPPVPPGGRALQRFPFLPMMVGTKMLQASLSLSNNTVIRGFKMVSVNAA